MDTQCGTQTDAHTRLSCTDELGGIAMRARVTHGKGASWDVDDRGAEGPKVCRKELCIEGGRHQDELEVGPAREQPPQDHQQEVRVDAATTKRNESAANTTLAQSTQIK